MSRAGYLGWLSTLQPDPAKGLLNQASANAGVRLRHI